MIFNAFPTNNGDAALVFSLFESFKSRGFDVKIAVQKFDIVKKLYNNYPFVRELADYKIINKIPFNKYFKPLIIPFLFPFSKDFMKADILIGSPGGYMNSYYGFSRVLITFVMAKLVGKKTGIYSQSFGPFDKKGRLLMKFLSYFINVIYARDSYSYKVLSEINVKKSKLYLVEDGAFLIPYMPAEPTKNTIAISVRSWKHDSRNQENYFNMIRRFTTTVIKHGYDVEFLSTCQGISGYIDDSKVAKEICENLPANILDKVTINSHYYKLDELQDYVGKFQAVIGTRLHMCILSMLRGKPCLNISYEVKGKETFTYLGLQKYTLDYNEDPKSADYKITDFLNSLSDKAKSLDFIMPDQNRKAKFYFEQFVEKLNK